MDLRPGEFLDCSTLGLLCRTRRRALERGGHLTLVCVQPWHLRILKAAGLHTLFEPLAACSGFGKYTLVGKQITALGPQLIGGVADDCSHLALAQHAYRPRRGPDALQVAAEGECEARMIP